MNKQNSVNIRPSVEIFSTLPRANYTAWYALAELIDNALQSSINLNSSNSVKHPLEVDICIDQEEKRITIHDNAGGISFSDFKRSFHLAGKPSNDSGLSEFGMGMKTAAFWFARKWGLRTTAFGEPAERTINFDLDDIVGSGKEEIPFTEKPAPAEEHYTEIIMNNIPESNFPIDSDFKKIKDHLSSIYRRFINEDSMRLTFNKEKLSYTHPEILVAPHYKDLEGQCIRWKKNIDINLGDSITAKGFVAILKTGDTKHAGLALFRRDRLIVGSRDNTYRPEVIFKRPNSFSYQRIFGEIQLDGLQVSHTKDGIQWAGHEEAFLEKLKKELSNESLPLIQQTENHKSKNKVVKDVKKYATKKKGNNPEPESKEPKPHKSIRQNSPTKIPPDEKIEHLLDCAIPIQNKKMKILYHSLTTVSAREHAILISLGLWAWWECLTELHGRCNEKSFKDYLIEYINKEEKFRSSRKALKKALKKAIGNIHYHGNMDKHNSECATFDAGQILPDAIALDPLTISLLEDMQEKRKSEEQVKRS